MDDNKLYLSLIRGATAIILLLILWGITDNLATRFGPVRPTTALIQVWPTGTQSGGTK